MNVQRDDGRNFRLFWFGEGVSLLGNATTVVLIALLAVVHLGAGPEWMGALTAAAWLPWLVVGIPAGAWVDRLPPRRVMIVADLVAAAALLSVPIAWWCGVLSLFQLLLVAFVGGVSTVFFRLAYVKLLPLIVPPAQLESANARLFGTESATQIAGPGMAGLLTKLGSATLGIAFDALSFLVSALCLWRIRPASGSSDGTVVGDPADSFGERIRQGARLVVGDPAIRSFTLIGGLSNFGLTGFGALLVLFWARELAVPSQVIGLLLTVGGAGGVLGAAVATRIGRRLGSGRASTVLLLVSAPAALLIGVPSSHSALWLSVFGLAVMDTAVVAGNVLRGAWRLRYVPGPLLARVTTCTQVINFGTMPFAALVAGWLGGTIGIRPAILALAAVHALAMVAVLLTSVGRRRELPEAIRVQPDEARRDTAFGGLVGGLVGASA
jgi:Transmembrane secretion effector